MCTTLMTDRVPEDWDQIKCGLFGVPEYDKVSFSCSRASQVSEARSYAPLVSNWAQIGLCGERLNERSSVFTFQFEPISFGMQVMLSPPTFEQQECFASQYSLVRCV